MAAFLAHRDSIGDSRSYIRPDAGIFGCLERHRTTDDFFGISTILATVLFFTDPANLDTKQLGLAMAASLWMLLPSILAFRFGQTYLEAGLTKGAVKG